MRFAVNGSSPFMGEVRRGCKFAVELSCGVLPSPDLSHRGRGGLWLELCSFAFINRVFDDGQDTLEIISNIRVPEAQDAKTLTCKKFVTNFVSRTIQVLTAVCLNNNFVFKANKIKNISLNWFLPTEFCAKIFTTQRLPKNAFLGSHVSSQFAGYVFHSHKLNYGVVAWHSERNTSHREGML